MPLRYLFVDFNSFFASVEQQMQPDLRGQPVAVVPVLTDSTCCIAASYEAKGFGIKTGTNVGEARKRCPRLKVIEARPRVYVDYHHRLIEAVDSVVPVREVLSIDEMACDLTGKYQQREEALATAHRVKSVIAERVGPWLRCSIGIAPNVFLSKTASDMQKPDGLVVIEPDDLPQCLHRLKLRDLCGIGSSMEDRLQQHGIYTVEALCAATPEELRRAWGSIEGERFYAKLHGHAVYDPPTKKSVVSHSHVLEPALRRDDAAFSVMNRLLQKAAMRLRKMGYLAGGLGAAVRYVDGRHWEDTLRLQETQDTLEFLNALETLWNRRPLAASSPMKVGVYLFHLTERGGETLPLFESGHARPALNQLIDGLNERFGKNAVYFGGAHTALNSAPMRIAFNRIPDLDTESDDAEDDE